jgi:outer membrane protein assembly factor BamA
VRVSQDPVINGFLNGPDTLETLFKPGDSFNINVLNEERGRITEKLQNAGYYKFNKEYITFVADTCRGQNYVDLTMDVKLHLEDGRSDPANHRKYYVGDVKFFTDVNNLNQERDSVSINGNEIYYNDRLRFRPKLLVSNNKLRTGNVYRDNDLQRSYRNFAKLPAISYSNIGLVQRGETDTLDCNIIINHSRPQTVSFDIEGTNSAGDLGAAAATT